MAASPNLLCVHPFQVFIWTGLNKMEEDKGIWFMKIFIYKNVKMLKY